MHSLEAVIVNAAAKRECWINVYKWWDAYNNKWAILMGKDHFETKWLAQSYLPSFGLTVAYRIHVRMK